MSYASYGVIAPTCPYLHVHQTICCCRRKDIFIAVAVDIIRFQSYGLQDNVALLVLLHRKGQLQHVVAVSAHAALWLALPCLADSPVTCVMYNVTFRTGSLVTVYHSHGSAFWHTL